MQSENIETVGRFIDAWNRRDLEAALEETHPQCEARPIEATETLRGHDGLRTAFRDLFEAFEEFTMEPEDFVAQGDCVLVPLRQRGRGKESGLEIEERFFQLFAMRDGKVFRFDEFSDETDARKALEE